MATKQKRDVSSQELGKIDTPSKAEIGGSIESTKVKEGSYKGLQDVVFEGKQEADLIKQVKSEYQFATRELKEWVDLNLKRLKLYNNQKRNEEHIGEPLLFTHMNSWIASIYDDTYDRVWIPREEGDIETAENLTAVADYDYDLMNKDELNFGEIWDALFFSYSVTDMLQFDPVKKCVMPNLIDPLVFYYDTYASTPDGNSTNRSGMRFLGWDMYMSKRDILDSPILGEQALKDLEEQDGGGMSHKDEARKQRLEAMGGTYSHFKRDDMQDNNVYELVQWRTMFDGKKVILILTPKCNKIIGKKFLPQDKKGNSVSWFISTKRFNPQPHQFKGVSLPDILEDKQRHKAMLINDQINLARSLTYGSYVYDQTKITNKLDLKWGYDKWIGIDGDPNSAIAPVRKDTSSLAFLDNTLGYIDISAQKASATPELQQGVLSEQQRTLGELNLVASSSKNRYSLALKTFANGEKDFWGLWYLQYKIHYSQGLGKKIVRIGGSMRVFRSFTADQFICLTDPDIKIESKSVNEARDQGKLKIFTAMFEFLMQDPDADKRSAIKKAYSLAGFTRQEIDTYLPLTSDEIIAKEQNEQIDKGVMPPFLVNDNHLVHIRIHQEALENDVKRNHILTHLRALKIEQEAPMVNADAMEQGMQPDEQAEVPMGGQPRSQGMAQEPEMTPSREASLLNQIR